MNAMIRRCANTILIICALVLFSGCGSGGQSLLQRHLIYVEGASNFRDFGGYTTANGDSIKWQQLYRSSDLSELTDIGLQTFESLNIRTVIDLRSTTEVADNPDRVPEGVADHNIPLTESIGLALVHALNTGDTSGLEFDALVAAYAEFYTDNLEIYQEILALVFSSANWPIDIHCTMGASRTGFTVALIQLILGVTENWVLEDFLLTNEAIPLQIQESVESFRETIIANTKQEPTEQDIENLTNFVTMHAEYLQSALNHVIEDYGSIDAFIRDGLEITDEDRSAFQAALLLPAWGV